MLKPIALFSLAVLVTPAWGEDMTYGDCAAMVDRSPQTAERKAADWQTHGGGVAAMHCHALALFGLRRYDEAARILDVLGANRDLSREERAALFDQSGSAWLLANKPREGVLSLSSALSLKPSDPGLLANRARARGLLKDWKGADADLSAVIAQDANRADLLVLRASSRWAQDKKADAAADIVRALEVYPDYPPALVERGKMKYFAGDTAGAQRDWQKAASSGQGETAAEAKRFLANLQAKGR